MTYGLGENVCANPTADKTPLKLIKNYQNNSMGQRDGPATKRSDCSCEGLEYSSPEPTSGGS